MSLTLPTPFRGTSKRVLLPWHKGLAFWYAEQPQRPTWRAILAVARTLEPSVTLKVLRKVLAHPTVQAWVRAYEAERHPPVAALAGSREDVVTAERVVPAAPDPLYNPENLERAEPTEAQRALGWRSYREHLEQMARESPTKRRYWR